MGGPRADLQGQCLAYDNYFDRSSLIKRKKGALIESEYGFGKGCGTEQGPKSAVEQLQRT